MIRPLAVCWGIALLLLTQGVSALEPPVITQETAELPTRTWVDESGYHRVQARLVGLGPTHVRLFKQNGYHSTLLLARLSRADQQYVAAVRAELAESAIEPETPPSRIGQAGDDGLQTVICLDASHDLLRELSPPIREQVPINVRLFGVPVQGVSYTQAAVDVRLVPDSKRAVLEMPIQGTVHSDTTSYVSILQVSTSGLTNFHKRFRLVIDDQGARLEQFPTWSSSNYVTTGISTAARAFRRLVLRVGSRRVAEQKAASDAEAARRQRARIDQAFNEAGQVLATRLDEALVRAREEFSRTNVFRGVQLGFATNPSHLEALVRLPKTETIVEAPSIVGNDAPLIVRIHNSALQDSMTEDAQQELQTIVERLSKLIPNAEGSLRGFFADSDLHVAESDDGSWLTISVKPKPGQPTPAPRASVADALSAR